MWTKGSPLGKRKKKLKRHIAVENPPQRTLAKEPEIRILKKKWLSDGIATSKKEIDQVRKDPMMKKMDINHNRESKFEKSDEHETFE
ncbi:hypothetical protein TNCV_1204141 [Trichonephila clavipes]|nr:hypothetical protein TNCV_1204141 [Trichonephila clavipes]